jgi:hypothetical protein
MPNSYINVNEFSINVDNSNIHKFDLFYGDSLILKANNFSNNYIDTNLCKTLLLWGLEFSIDKGVQFFHSKNVIRKSINIYLPCYEYEITIEFSLLNNRDKEYLNFYANPNKKFINLYLTNLHKFLLDTVKNEVDKYKMISILKQKKNLLELRFKG